MLNDDVNKRICQKKLIKVFNVRLQLIIEASVSKAVENFFTSFNWLVTQDNLFNLFICLDKHINIHWVENFVVW